MKRRVFLDMDGVIVDFERYMADTGLTADEVKRAPGAYRDMRPIPDALDGVREIIAMGYDVWLATKPPTGVAYAYAAKAAWVFEHLPELESRVIITHDKGLLGSAWDILVDDRPERANCAAFDGTLLKFGPGGMVSDWPSLLTVLRLLKDLGARWCKDIGVLDITPAEHIPDAVGVRIRAALEHHSV